MPGHRFRRSQFAVADQRPSIIIARAAVKRGQDASQRPEGGAPRYPPVQNA